MVKLQVIVNLLERVLKEYLVIFV